MNTVMKTDGNATTTASRESERARRARERNTTEKTCRQGVAAEKILSLPYRKDESSITPSEEIVECRKMVQRRHHNCKIVIWM